jgi:enamine deaminase RidA (YjgF/YER057c/UK114 family)
MTPAVQLANYVPYMLAGSFLYLSGQGPREPDGFLHTGNVGAAIGLDEARGHARTTGLNLLSAVHAALGDRGRVSRVVKLLGMVNALKSFTEHSRVVNGASHLFVAVFGDVGRHAHSAVGMCSLPRNIHGRDRGDPGNPSVRVTQPLRTTMKRARR